MEEENRLVELEDFNEYSIRYRKNGKSSENISRHPPSDIPYLRIIERNKYGDLEYDFSDFQSSITSDGINKLGEVIQGYKILTEQNQSTSTTSVEIRGNSLVGVCKNMVIADAVQLSKSLLRVFCSRQYRTNSNIHGIAEAISYYCEPNVYETSAQKRDRRSKEREHSVEAILEHIINNYSKSSITVDMAVETALALDDNLSRKTVIDALKQLESDQVITVRSQIIRFKR
jgi:hypothetical protein